MIAAFPSIVVKTLERLAAVVHAHHGGDPGRVAWAHGADAAGEGGPGCALGGGGGLRRACGVALVKDSVHPLGRGESVGVKWLH